MWAASSVLQPDTSMSYMQALLQYYKYTWTCYNTTEITGYVLQYYVYIPGHGNNHCSIYNTVEKWTICRNITTIFTREKKTWQRITKLCLFIDWLSLSMLTSTIIHYFPLSLVVIKFFKMFSRTTFCGRLLRKLIMDAYKVTAKTKINKFNPNNSSLSAEHG